MPLWVTFPADRHHQQCLRQSTLSPPRAHSTFPHSAVPILSPVHQWQPVVWVLKVSRFQFVVAAIKDTQESRICNILIILVHCCLERPYPDPLLQFLSPSRDFRPTCHNLFILIMEKSPTKNWLQLCYSCWNGWWGQSGIMTLIVLTGIWLGNRCSLALI